MTIRVLLFASYREMAGVREMRLELPEGSRVRDVVALLRARGGGLASLPQDPPVAVNRSYVSPATPLADGDEVALLPPVAGG
jgi:molybdopterin converting factor subunit 1